MKRITSLLLFVVVAVSAMAAYPDNVKIKKSKGATINGVVYCGDRPVAGVAVSDGVNVALTNAVGVYQLNSAKRYGLVYISTPSGYEPVCEKQFMPKFWAATTMPAKQCERHDFELKQVDNSRFSLIVSADLHLCNDPKRNDLEGFSSLFMPCFREILKANNDVPAYSIVLGDMTWDRFWYATGMDPQAAVKFLAEQGYSIPLYSIMGNHDNDASIAPDENTDFLSENVYRKTFGPTYYSFNIGGVHFIMLDNIVYKNEVKEGMIIAKNVAGSRNYDCYVTANQIEWLRKDLANVDKSTPLVMCMHSSLFKRDKAGAVVSAFDSEESYNNLIDLVKDYVSVRVLSGHRHHAHTCVHPTYSHIIEYNVPSAAGELWKSVRGSGRNIGIDGADGGMYLFAYDNGKYVRTFYSEQDGDCPMRVYDMNAVKEFYASSEVMQHLCQIQKKQLNYAEVERENCIYINCWMLEPGATLTVAENGEPLAIEPTSDNDPLASAWLLGPELAKKKKGYKPYIKRTASDHLYCAKAKAADSEIVVTLTTSDGRVYTKTLTRPTTFPPVE